MKIAYALLLAGVVLMAAAFAVPKLFGGGAALRGELEQELATSGELHMKTAQSQNGSESAPQDTPEGDLEQRIDAALHRGQGTASVLKWLGIGAALAGVVILVMDKSKSEGK